MKDHIQSDRPLPIDLPVYDDDDHHSALPIIVYVIAIAGVVLGGSAAFWLLT